MGWQSNSYQVGLHNVGSFQADFKVSRLYLLAGSATQATASVSAGLTGILADSLRDNWSGSSGVG